MRRLALIAVVCSVSAASVSAARADELEEILLHKFTVLNKVDSNRLRAYVLDAVNKAKEIKDSDPERGLDLLRQASARIDGVKQLNVEERRAMAELVQPLVQELRDVSLAQRREKASRRLDAFKEWIELSAYEGKSPGRSGPEKWEPANIWTPDGFSRVGKIYGLGTGAVTIRYGQKELNPAPPAVPLIQVFGGLYVYDKNHAHHVFLTNREFYDNVWRQLAREFSNREGAPPGKVLRAVRPEDDKLLMASVNLGEHFLRGLPNLDPIPGLTDDEGAFLTYLVQKVMNDNWPVPMERIYPFEFQDRLTGLTKLQMSAVRRTLWLLQAKDTAVSPLYAEILREETAKVIRSEYSNFLEGELNQSLLYIFSKLK